MAGLISENMKEYDFENYKYYANITVEDRSEIINSDENEDISNDKADEPRISIPIPYHQIITRKSDKYRIEPSLIRAIIKVESNWDSKAVSRKGAMGLMQLMPSTAKDMKVKNPFDPEENIDGGTRYLRYLLNKFNGDITLAIAAYNAGPTKVMKFRGIPPIKETKQYVKKIFSIYSRQELTF